MFRFHNDIKRLYILKYAKGDVVDLASGRGGDILKYVSNKNVTSVTGYDINMGYIREARSRVNKKFRIKIKYFLKDLGKEVIPKQDSRADTIVCNFAFHYFFKNRDTLGTVLKSISNISKKGTIFILSLFDGKKVKEKLIEQGGNIKTNFFEITPVNVSNRKQYGNAIDVFLKDSVLSEPVTEYLVNPDFLIKKINSIGFSLVEMKSFTNVEKFKLLPKLSQEFSSLNNVYVFEKK